MAATERIKITARPDDPWHRPAVAFACTSDDGWTATGTVARTGSRGVVITEVTFYGQDDEGAPGAVTSTALRRLPSGEILAQAMRCGLLANDQKVAPRRSIGRPGRAPLSDDLIRIVAQTYLEETTPGKPRGALQRLSVRFSKPVPTISRWVMRARADQWLGPAVPGREGGEPGPRLIAEQQQAS